MTFRQALAKHRFIAALLIIGMAIHSVLLIIHVHDILIRDIPVDFLFFYFIFYLCLCGYLIVRMTQTKPMLRWFCLVLILSFYTLLTQIPAFGSARPFSERHACISNMRSIYTACLAYADDHAGFYPSSLQLLLKGDRIYLQRETLHCPACRKRQKERCDYLYYGAGLIKGREPMDYLLLQDKLYNHKEKRFQSKLFLDKNDFRIEQKI